VAETGRLQGFLARKEPEAEPGLNRTLGVPTVVGLGIGAIIGAGLFSLTGIAAAENAGPAVTLSFLLAGIGCAFAGLCYSELAGMIPSAGSAYAYAYAGLGELVAWIIGWDLLLEYSVAAAAVAVSWSSYFQSLLHGWGLDLPHWLTAGPAAGGVINLPALAIIVLLSIVLIGGIAESALVNSLIVVLKVAIVLLVIGVGAFYVHVSNWLPFIPPNAGGFGHFGISGVLRGAGIVFFAYLGFDAVSTTAAEARNPKRAMPIGIMGSLLICTVLYIAFSLVLTGVVHYPDMKGNAAPVALLIDKTPFPWLQVVVKLAILGGFTSVLLVGLLGQSRIAFAMAEDGMIPAVLGKLHPKRKTPWVANLVFMVGTGTLAALVPIDTLAKLVSVGTLLAFAIVCGGVIVLRHREPDRPRPFRVPGSPVVPALGIVTCLLLIASLPHDTWIRLAVWFAIGLAVYFGYSHRRAAARREPAAGEHA
jgi:APA family basic amino acid/polyamine antiporter